MAPNQLPRAFEWQPEFDSGVPAIDRQHRQLVRYLNELFTSVQRGNPRSDLERIIEQLVSYTTIHCNAEEALMREENWPGLEDHQRKHRKLILEMNSLQAKFTSGNLTFNAETMGFLTRWFRNHIIEEDKEFTAGRA